MFLKNRLLWVLAAATALMTAFYMFRLMSMTFYGVYAARRGHTVAIGTGMGTATPGTARMSRRAR